MIRSNLIGLLLASLLSTAVGEAQTDRPPIISRDAAYEVLAPAEGKKAGAKPEGLEGRVVTGYQGWFRAEGDGSRLGFSHYGTGRKFEPGSCTIDLWPDLSEFSEAEKFPTPFQHADGSVAHVFSSIHPKTVDRHFKWMADYEIDGAFVQRFATHGGKERGDNRRLMFENQKLMLCRDAAIKHKGSWVLMYDLSGMTDDNFTTPPTVAASKVCCKSPFS